MKINWLTINGQPVPTTFREKMVIISIAFCGIFVALFASIVVLLILVGFMILLASPFILVGEILWGVFS
jgi:hypothetical protein